MDRKIHVKWRNKNRCAFNPISWFCDRSSPTLQIQPFILLPAALAPSSLWRGPLFLSEFKLIPRREMTRAKLLSIARPMPHKGDAREDKTRRAAPIRGKFFFSAPVFLTTKGSACPKRGSWKCNCSRVGREIGGGALSFGGRERERDVEERFPQEYNRRNGRLLRADISASRGALEADARSPEKHSGRSFDVSSLPPHGPPIRHSPHNLSESRENCGFSWEKRGSGAAEATATRTRRLRPVAAEIFHGWPFFFLPQLPLRRDGIVAVKVLCD